MYICTYIHTVYITLTNPYREIKHGNFLAITAYTDACMLMHNEACAKLLLLRAKHVSQITLAFYSIFSYSTYIHILERSIDFESL